MGLSVFADIEGGKMADFEYNGTETKEYVYSIESGVINVPSFTYRDPDIELSSIYTKEGKKMKRTDCTPTFKLRDQASDSDDGVEFKALSDRVTIEFIAEGVEMKYTITDSKSFQALRAFLNSFEYEG